LWGLTRTYWTCPAYSVPSSLVDALAFYLPVPLIARFHGPEAAGYFSLVRLVFGVPASLLGASVADAFHERMARCARETPSETRHLFVRMATGLLAIVIGPAIILGLFGPAIFAMVFGPQWAPAGVLAALLAPGALVQLVVNPMSRVVLVFQRHDLKFVYDVLSLGAIVFALGFLDGGQAPLATAIMWLSAVQVLSSGVYFFLLLRVVSARTTPAVDGAEVRTAVAAERHVD
jgi:O-antigen/teichoic acid export membrane protein